MTATTHRVAGMRCDGCVRAVTNAIHELAPAADVSVDLAAGRVTVVGAEANLIREAVTAAGFDYAGAVPE
jgi:copper chaperone